LLVGERRAFLPGGCCHRALLGFVCCSILVAGGRASITRTGRPPSVGVVAAVGLAAPALLGEVLKAQLGAAWAIRLDVLLRDPARGDDDRDPVPGGSLARDGALVARHAAESRAGPANPLDACGSSCAASSGAGRLQDLEALRVERHDRPGFP